MLELARANGGVYIKAAQFVASLQVARRRARMHTTLTHTPARKPHRQPARWARSLSRRRRSRH